MSLQTWILTFERPIALNRLIKHFNEQGIIPNIFSNSPLLEIDPVNKVGEIIVNSLNSRISNSWCARSWNAIYQKAFEKPGTQELVCIQDDTDISPNYVSWLNKAKDEFNFIWGPAGDQFHYLTLGVLQMIGWWDERYIGCYCGDAEYVKRVFMDYDRRWISVDDSHNWGFKWQPCDLPSHVITTYESKTCDPTYENQHWALDKLAPVNETILHSQQHFRDKWGVDLDNNQPVVTSLDRKMKEIDWYPSYTKKLGIYAYERDV